MTNDHHSRIQAPRGHQFCLTKSLGSLLTQHTAYLRVNASADRRWHLITILRCVSQWFCRLESTESLCVMHAKGLLEWPGQCWRCTAEAQSSWCVGHQKGGITTSWNAIGMGLLTTRAAAASLMPNALFSVVESEHVRYLGRFLKEDPDLFSLGSRLELLLHLAVKRKKTRKETRQQRRYGLKGPVAFVSIQQAFGHFAR